MSERWTGVPGFTGYLVSSEGNFLTTRGINGRGTSRPRPLNPRLVVGKKYLRVTLTDTNGKRVDRKVHLLVLEAFIGPRPSAMHDGCHNNGNATDNRLANLRWGTKQDNADDRVRHGTQVRGDTSGVSKLTEAQVLEIKAALPSWKRGMGRHFALKFGVGDSAIADVKSGRTWSHL